MSLGDNIKTKRKEKSLTQEQLSEKLKVSRQAVSNWERNIKNPDFFNLAELSVILDCSIDELLKDELSIARKNHEINFANGRELKISKPLLNLAKKMEKITSRIYVSNTEDKEDNNE